MPARDAVGEDERACNAALKLADLREWGELSAAGITFGGLREKLVSLRPAAAKTPLELVSPPATRSACGWLSTPI
jgi:hypothetical protein